MAPKADAVFGKPAGMDGVHSAGLGDNVARQEPSMGASASPGRGGELGERHVTSDGEEFCAESGRK